MAATANTDSAVQLPLFADLAVDPSRGPNSPLLTDAHRSLDARTLQAAVDAAARWLRALLPASAAVGLQLPNSVEFVVLLLALARNGQPAVLFPHDAPAHEVQAQINTDGIALLISDSNAGSGTEATPGSPGTTPRTRAPERCGLPWPAQLCTVITEVDPPAHGGLVPTVFIAQFTSGQDSAPKRVLRTQTAVAAEIRSLLATLPLTAHDRVLVASRISHSYGLIGGVLAALAAGAHAILAPGADAAAVLTLAQQHKPTVLLGVPPLYRNLLKHDLHDLQDRLATLRLALSAGAPLPDTTAVAFRDRTGLTIQQDYGATECGTISLGSPADAAAPGCVGRPLAHLRVQVCGPTGAALAAGCIGEVMVHDSNDSRATTPFATGDLGHLDADGRLFLHGRRSSQIHIGGRTFDPAALEARLALLPGVHDVAVTTGARGGLMIHAVAAGDQRGHSDHDNGLALLAACQQQLGPELPVDGLRLLPQLPRSAAGKILRRRLTDGTSPEAPQ